MGSDQRQLIPPRVSARSAISDLADDGWADARTCRRITARYARTFTLAARLLPTAKRRAAFAIYATCRTADDIVDAGIRDDRARALRQFRSEAIQALHHPSTQPILRELARAWRSYRVPDEYLVELFDGLERDLSDHEYATWSDLAEYCQGVAGSVGAMCLAVFGVAASDTPVAAASTSARMLGVAMQLTNILRDVGEDARRGRCYLPVEDLRAFGFSAADVVSGAARERPTAWRELMAFEIGRARSLYREAEPGFTLLAHDARRCAIACANGYASILDAIEAANGDTFARRVTASRLTLLGIAWRAWRGEVHVPLAPHRLPDQ